MNTGNAQKRPYSYEGSVFLFGREVLGKWKASTVAVSENKARNNLAHQAKVLLQLPIRSPVTLPGRLTIQL